MSILYANYGHQKWKRDPIYIYFLNWKNVYLNRSINIKSIFWYIIYCNFLVFVEYWYNYCTENLHFDIFHEIFFCSFSWYFIFLFSKHTQFYFLTLQSGKLEIRELRIIGFMMSRGTKVSIHLANKSNTRISFV